MQQLGRKYFASRPPPPPPPPPANTASPGTDFCTGLIFLLGTSYLPEKV